MTRRIKTSTHLLGHFGFLLATASLAFVLIGAARAAPPTPAYAPDHLLVRFKANTPPAVKGRARSDVGARLVHAYKLVPDLELLAIPAAPQAVDNVIKALSHRPEVEYAEPDYIIEAVETPNDPRYGSLWGMINMGAPTAWDVSQGDPNMVVAIIDTGIDYTHTDLAANIWTNSAELYGTPGVDDDGNGYVDDVYGWDFVNNDPDPYDDNGHGTHVAGTVGAVGNNGIGVVGVNWQVELMVIKIMGANGSGPTSAAMMGIEYATDMGVRVSNNSWTDPGSQSLYDAIDASRDAGHLFIAAAGNGLLRGHNNDSNPTYPASYGLANIIAVAAINSSDSLASFSNYGLTNVDLGAPGQGILSTLPGGGYGSKNGTSMAAPHVAGATALLYAGCEGLGYSYQDIRALLLNSTRPLSSLAGKTVTGGTLDLAQAVADASSYGCFGGAADSPPTVSVIGPDGTAPLQGTLTVSAKASDDHGVTTVEFQVDGTTIGIDNQAAGGWTIQWDTTKVSNGSHTLKAIATDTAGQTSPSNGVAVTVQNPVLDTFMHVGDLVGSATSRRRSWSVEVTVTILDSAGKPVGDVAVTGAWTGGARGTTTCMSAVPSGQCTLSKGRIRNNQASVTFTVTDVIKSGMTYDASANIKTTITVLQP